MSREPLPKRPTGIVMPERPSLYLGTTTTVSTLQERL
jgi:hypothetical protein